MEPSGCVIDDCEQSSLSESFNARFIFACDEKPRSPLSISQGGGHCLLQTEPFYTETDDRCLSSPPELTSDTDDQVQQEVAFDSAEDCSEFCSDVKHDSWKHNSDEEVNSTTSRNEVNLHNVVSTVEHSAIHIPSQRLSHYFTPKVKALVPSDSVKCHTCVRKSILELYGQPSWWGQDNDDEEVSYRSTSERRGKLITEPPGSKAVSMDEKPVDYDDSHPKSEQCPPRPSAEAFVIDFSTGKDSERRHPLATGDLSQYVPPRLRQGFLERENQKKEREKQMEMRRQTAAQNSIKKKPKSLNIRLQRSLTSADSGTLRTNGMSGQLSGRASNVFSRLASTVRRPTSSTTTSFRSKRTVASDSTAPNRSSVCCSPRSSSLRVGQPNASNKRQLTSENSNPGRVAAATSTPASPLSRVQCAGGPEAARTLQPSKKTTRTTEGCIDKRAVPRVSTSASKVLAGTLASGQSPIARDTKLTLARKKAAYLKQTGSLVASDNATAKTAGRRTSFCASTATSVKGDRLFSSRMDNGNCIQHRSSLPRGFMSPTTSSGAKHMISQPEAAVRAVPEKSTNLPTASSQKKPGCTPGNRSRPTTGAATSSTRPDDAQLNLRQRICNKQQQMTKAKANHSSLSTQATKCREPTPDYVFQTSELTASVMAEIEAYNDPKEYLFYRMFQGAVNETVNAFEDSANSRPFPGDFCTEPETTPPNATTFLHGVREPCESKVASSSIKTASNEMHTLQPGTETLLPTARCKMSLDDSVANPKPVHAVNQNYSYRTLNPPVSSKSPTLQRKMFSDVPDRFVTDAERIPSLNSREANENNLKSSMLVCTSVASLAATYVLDAEETLLSQQERLKQMLQSGQSVGTKLSGGNFSTNSGSTGERQLALQQSTCEADSTTPRGSPNKEFEEFERLAEEKDDKFWEFILPNCSTELVTSNRGTPTEVSNDPATPSISQAVSSSELRGAVQLKSEAQQSPFNRTYTQIDRKKLVSDLITQSADTRSQDDIDLETKSGQDGILLPGTSLTSLARTYVIDRGKVVTSDALGMRPILPEGQDLEEEDIVSASIEWVTNQPNETYVPENMRGVIEVDTPIPSPAEQRQLRVTAALDGLSSADDAAQHSPAYDGPVASVNEGFQTELDAKHSPNNKNVQRSPLPHAIRSDTLAWRLVRQPKVECPNYYGSKCQLQPDIAFPESALQSSSQGYETHSQLTRLPPSTVADDFAHPQSTRKVHLDQMITHPYAVPNTEGKASGARNLDGSYTATEQPDLHKCYLALQTSVKQQLQEVHNQGGISDYLTSGLMVPQLSRNTMVQDNSSSQAEVDAHLRCDSVAVRRLTATHRPFTGNTTTGTVSNSRPFSMWNRHDRRNRSTTSLDTALKCLEYSSGRIESKQPLRRSVEHEYRGSFWNSLTNSQRYMNARRSVREGENRACSGSRDASTAHDTSHPLAAKCKPVRCYSLRSASSLIPGPTSTPRGDTSPTIPLSNKLTPYDPDCTHLDPIDLCLPPPRSLRSSGDGVSDKVTNYSSAEGASSTNGPADQNNWDSKKGENTQNQIGSDQPTPVSHPTFDSRTFTRRPGRQRPDHEQSLSINDSSRNRPLDSDISIKTSRRRDQYQSGTFELPDSTTEFQQVEAPRSAFRTPIPQQSYLLAPPPIQAWSTPASAANQIRPGVRSESSANDTGYCEGAESTVPYTCMVDSIHQLSLKLRHCSDRLIERIHSERPEKVSGECRQSTNSTFDGVPSKTKLALTSALTNMQTIKDQLTAAEQILSAVDQGGDLTTNSLIASEDGQQFFTFIPIDLDNGRTKGSEPNHKAQLRQTNWQLQKECSAPSGSSVPQQHPRTHTQRKPTAVPRDERSKSLSGERIDFPTKNYERVTEFHRQWTNLEDEFY